ncbi:MAG: NosD domain-containing protein [Candidatus Kariarchaeaceae archaeon]
MSWNVAVETPLQDGELNVIFTEGVGSAIFHGPTSVLGYQDGVVDLTETWLEGVEVIMQSSEDSTALDQDETFSEFDYYSMNKPDRGSYPMIAVQNMYDNKYVIASGEVIYSDYKSQYSYETFHGEWNGGFHEGKQLVDNILSWFGYVIESEVPQPEPQLRVAFDVSHYPTVHYDAYMLEEALTSVDVEFRYLWNIYELSEDIDVLLVPSSTMIYDEFELDFISGWFGTEGKKLLWIAGDSDYDGWYPAEPNNAILERIDARLRISADGVHDFVKNDDAFYRVAVQTPVSDGEYNSIFTDGVSSAIFHGPTSVLGYQDGIVDLTEFQPDGVEIIMQASEHAQVVNQDGSTSDFDYYSMYKPFGGSYPMMAIDSHFGDDKYVIASGEPIFTDYKQMYNLFTQQGLWGNPEAWNGGIHDGKILVDNIFNWFDLDPALPRYYGHAPIYIEGDDDFRSQALLGFPGSGESDDPFRIEGFSFLPDPNVNSLITIIDTTVYFQISDNYLNGFWNMEKAIYLQNVGNGIIANNIIRNNVFGIDVINIYDCTVANNEIYDNAHDAIRMWYSEKITFDSNVIYNTGASGFSINTATDINVIDNTLFNNQYGMHTYLFDYSFISGNGFFGNFEVGLNLWECMNNEISNNVFFYQGFASIGLYYSESNTFSDNTVCGSGFGVLLETSQNNNITNNEIFETDIGIFLNNKAGNNRCKDNILWANNQGICISNDPSSVLELWPDQYIFATDSDSIKWQATWIEWLPEIYPINEVHDYLLQVYLTVDGVPVEVSFSEVYFNGEQWCFDITYLSDPLSVGEHEFASQFVLAGEIIGTPIAHVNVMPTPPVHNIIFRNTLFDNNNGILLQNANDNFVGGNTLTNNFGEGIGVYGSCNNRIVWNHIESSGLKGIMVTHDFGWDITSEFNTIANNTIFGGAEDGISLEWVHNNVIEDNKISWNNWAGVRLYGTSSNNDILDNSIHNNWGGGIAFESYSNVFMRYWWDITATEADHISWQASYRDESESVIQSEYLLTEVVLTVDGNPVGPVWFSEIYFDWDLQQYRFDMDCYLEPLPVGEHEFHTEFFRDGVLQDQWTWTAIVTVEPATADDYVFHNYIAGNEIFENSWNGINLQRSHYNTFTGNFVHNNFGDGIYVSGSNNVLESNDIYGNEGCGVNLDSADKNFINYNNIFENGWTGIQLSGTSSENSLVGNSIHHSLWGAGISLDSFSQVELYFGQDITATEVDSISWYENFWGPIEIVQFWHDNLEVLLTVDGESVGVWFSEIYYDGEQGWFDMSYFSDPLPVGVYEFTIQFTLAGEFLSEDTSHVTVVPATDENYVSHNTISGNDIFENGWIGINLQRTHYNTFTGNFIHDNTGDGIYIKGSNNVLESNDIYENEGCGVNLDAADSNFITNNNIFENDWTGIQLSGTSSENSLVGNSIHHSLWGAGISLDSFSQVEIFFGQDITATEADYISWYDSFMGSEEEVQFRYNNLEVLLTVDGESVEVGFSEIYYDGEQGWFDMGYFSDPLPAGVYEFTIQFILAGLEEWTSTALVTVIPATDENYVSHNTISGNDIYENGWAGINIQRAHYNVLDMNTISYNAGQGIWIGDSEFNKLINNGIDSNGADSGLNLYQSSNHLVSGNTITKNMFGILLEESDSNRIIKNIVCDNYDSGIHLMGTSSDNTIVDNVIYRSGAHGIAISSFSEEPDLNYASHNCISDNDIYEFRWMGIGLWGSHYNYISCNTISTGLAGIRLQDSRFNTITKNKASGCENGGIMLVFSSDYNLVTRNKLYGQERTGIFVWFSSFNEITRNNLFENNAGLVCIEGNSNEYRRNTIRANSIGISLISSSDSILSRNFLYSNTETGLYLVDGSSGNSISRNIVHGSGNAGITILGGSNDNNVVRNIVKGSSFGILLDSTSFNNVYRNTVYNCEFGITLEFSDENQVSRNCVFRNEEGIFLSHSSSNCISRNFVFCNGIGIHLLESSDNTLYRNFVFRNDDNLLEEP